MVQKILEICLSETHASGNRESQTEDLNPSNVDSRCKGDYGMKGMKGGHKRRRTKSTLLH